MTVSSLDADELFQLALLDIEQSRHDGAIEKLKRARELRPTDARIHFLLAAEHAEIRLFDRAEEEFRRALELDPLLHTARFQLGLLHFTRDEFEEAEAVWRDLDTVTAADAQGLILFKDGLLQLKNGERDSAMELLERVARESANAGLIADARRILANLKSQGQEPPAGGEVTADKSSTATPAAGLIHRYGETLSSGS